MIGPAGEIVIAGAPHEDESTIDWAWLWDCTEGWGCDEHDIRRAILSINVPILGPANKVVVAAGDIKILPAPANDSLQSGDESV